MPDGKVERNSRSAPERVGSAGPGPAGPACTCAAQEEALLSPPRRLRPGPASGHAQKPLGGVGFPSHAGRRRGPTRPGSPRVRTPRLGALGEGGRGRRGGAGRGLAVISRAAAAARAVRGNRKWAAAAAVAQTETAAGAGSGGVGTGRGPPEPGERTSCGRGCDRCPAKSDKVGAGAAHLCPPRDSGPGGT